MEYVVAVAFLLLVLVITAMVYLAMRCEEDPNEYCEHGANIGTDEYCFWCLDPEAEEHTE